MEKYIQEIATNDKVELIHVSLDQDEDKAEEWAEKNQFPWPTVSYKKKDSSGLAKYAGRGVPHYVLIDKDGEVITENKIQSFHKIEELTKSP